MMALPVGAVANTVQGGSVQISTYHSMLSISRQPVMETFQ